MNGVWFYVGEGGKHALFQCAAVKGKLLRIEKSLLRHAETLPPEYHFGNWGGFGIIEASYHSTTGILQSIIAPFLAPYVDLPQIVGLTWGFLQRLRKETLGANLIPPSRIDDWQPKDEKVQGNQPTGWLVIDYRHIPRSMEADSNSLDSRKISIELKPKAGYLSWSPLIDPKNRVKLSQSRFSLLQTLHQSGHVKKGWAKNIDDVQKSEYNPLDLFSEDQGRISKAIYRLLANPQNNLRFWYKNQLLTKNGSIDRKDMEIFVRDLLFDGEEKYFADCDSAFNSFTCDLLLPVLKREPILSKLLLLQKLDYMDMDGVILVSERLFDLCGKSKESAEAALSNWQVRGEGNTMPVDNMFSETPFQLPSNCNDLLEFGEVLKSFRAIMNGCQPSLPSRQVLDDFHLKSTSIVSRLSKDECVFLLVNWLLSLAMCDASIFLTFAELGRTTVATHSSSNEDVAISGENTRGTVCIKKSDGSHLYFGYVLKMIDCDAKPPCKVWGRKKTEAAFRFLSKLS